MRSVSTVGAILLLAILTVPVSADDLPPGMEPPEARIGPPTGVTTTDEPPTIFELFLIWLQARIGPPTG